MLASRHPRRAAAAPSQSTRTRQRALRAPGARQATDNQRQANLEARIALGDAPGARRRQEPDYSDLDGRDGVRRPSSYACPHQVPTTALATLPVLTRHPQRLCHLTPRCAATRASSKLQADTAGKRWPRTCSTTRCLQGACCACISLALSGSAVHALDCLPLLVYTLAALGRARTCRGRCPSSPVSEARAARRAARSRRRRWASARAARPPSGARGRRLPASA
jgi:hypothetical protein